MKNYIQNKSLNLSPQQCQLPVTLPRVKKKRQSRKKRKRRLKIKAKKKTKKKHRSGPPRASPKLLEKIRQKQAGAKVSCD